MNMLPLSLIAALVASAVPTMADAQNRRGDGAAAREQGQLLPLREIERRVIPQFRGSQYLGFDFDAGTAVYTLKFLRDGTVIWVSVDGRSGAVIGRTGR